VKTIAMLSMLLINPVHVDMTRDIVVDVDYATQRCIPTDCTCKLSLDSVHTESTTSNNVSAIENIFFSEDDEDLDALDREKIKSFLSDNPGERKFTIVGYTDGCGGNGYNYSLARSRAHVVSRLISSSRSGSRSTIRYVSELSPGHDSSARRVDIFLGDIASDPNKLYKNLSADYYLIDGSGSMSSSYNSWIKAISKSKNRSSKIFISKSSYCYNGQDALSISASGGTEIWYSLWHIVKMMEPGKKLIVISDFQSSVPLSSTERVIISGIISNKNLQVVGIMP